MAQPVFGVNVPRNTLTAINAAARSLGMTRSRLAREAIHAYLAALGVQVGVQQQVSGNQTLLAPATTVADATPTPTTLHATRPHPASITLAVTQRTDLPGATSAYAVVPPSAAAPAPSRKRDT